ncbi:MAG TPA: FixH family protein [Segetibacter sp.]|nr:FixH family protein [Segetibacter sp.]
MTWGTKLLLVFTAFALLMSTLVYMCMKQKFELVSKDYYKDELRYQDKIDGMNNANKIGNVLIQENQENVSIQLPKEVQGLALKGQATFYCTVNSLNDRTLPLEVNDEGFMLISKTKLAKAKYLVKLNWQIGNDLYYTEKKLSVD